ncbi:hypothetical protein CASFOL_033888 [Castilleja foliolosa]|uniref:DNA endonuclease activator Ctp1 C-terminal domain-containing protein n=1 Tax=Castilleja foliolosa TaxID=1961234 RepID=A0ABD3BYX4_9LAMI
MENNLKKSPHLGHTSSSSDAKYISGLSTILVATIQEAKDRISQIEYIFCSQLYPNCQLNPQTLQKIYSEAKEAAEAAFKQKEKDLQLQIEELQCQTQQALEENQILKSAKAKFTVVEERYNVLLKTQKKLEIETGQLRQELMKKSKEVDEVMEIQNKLLQINQTKSSLVLQKDIQLKEYEEKVNGLVSKLEKMENKANELLSGLRDKTEEVNKGNELQGNLLKKIETQSLEIMSNEQILNKYEKENRVLAAELEKKGLELLDKRKGLEDEVNKLQQKLSERTTESSEGMELHGKLLQQIEAKDSELVAEKKKKRDVITAYKKLKSQYNYLLKKCALTPETGLALNKMDDESEIIRCNQTPVTSRVMENNKASDIAGDKAKLLNEQEVLGDKKGTVFVQEPSPISPFTSIISNGPKPSPPAGGKRPLSYWRDTRSHQSRVGPDLHDDFLDTPLENVRGNLGKAMKEDITDQPRPGPINMNLDDDSDDQTQDMNVDDDVPQNRCTSPPKVGTSGFKYVGPVRKKAEREKLKGIECKQCKKFYDAVLPNGGDKQNMRCEHHDGVSRHRYRYAPPSTPEGFWNIGFESEM